MGSVVIIASYNAIACLASYSSSIFLRSLLYSAVSCSVGSLSPGNSVLVNVLLGDLVLLRGALEGFLYGDAAGGSRACRRHRLRA